MRNTSQLIILAAMLSSATLPTLAMDRENFDDAELARQLSRQVSIVDVREETISVDCLNSSLEILRGLDPEGNDRDIQRQISSLEAQKRRFLEEQAQFTFETPVTQTAPSIQTPHIQPETALERARRMMREGTQLTSEDLSGLTLEEQLQFHGVLQENIPAEQATPLNSMPSQIETKFDRIRNKVLTGQQLTPGDLRGLSDDDQLALMELQQESRPVEAATSSITTLPQIETKFDRIRNKVLTGQQLTPGDLRGLSDDDQIALMELQQESRPVEAATSSITTLPQIETKFDRIRNKVLTGQQLTPGDLRGLSDDDQIALMELQQESRPVEAATTNASIIQEQEREYQKSLHLDTLKEQISTSRSEIEQIEEQIKRIEKYLDNRQVEFETENKELILNINNLDKQLTTAKSWAKRMHEASTQADPREERLSQLQSSLKEKQDTYMHEEQAIIAYLDLLKQNKEKAHKRLSDLEAQFLA